MIFSPLAGTISQGVTICPHPYPYERGWTTVTLPLVLCLFTPSSLATLKTKMKYLVSALELGKLIEANKQRRKEIVDGIMNLQYVRGTSDKENLDDCIEINKGKK